MSLIRVTGWYDRGNIGDESYKLSFPRLLRDVNLSFSDKDNNPSSLILGGGDVASVKNVEAMKSSGLPHDLLSATVSDNEINLSSFRNVFVRDRNSLSIASKTHPNPKLVPDVAFVLEPDPIRGRKKLELLFWKSQRDLYSNTVAVIVNAHLAPTNTSQYWQGLSFERFAIELARALDHISASAVFIPYGTQSPWDDKASCAWVQHKTKFWKKNVVAFENMDVQTTLDVMSACTTVISTRLHSSIFSTLSAVPFLDIVHNHKNAGFLSMIGHEEFGVDYYEMSGMKVASHISDLIVKRKEKVKSLSEVRDSMKIQLKESYDHLDLLR